MKQYHIHVGDLVQVIAGDEKGEKDKKTKGRVLKILRKSDRVLVEKVNMGVRHTRPNPHMQQPGGRIEKEMPIHISNVMVECPSCMKATRIGHRLEEDKSGRTKKVRYCKKCNATIADQGGKKK